MTTSELLERYRWALASLEQLRVKAGATAPELEDSLELRAEARRFAGRLGNAPDEATAEIDLLADHAGAQAFWAVLQSRWEPLEMMLLPSAFELVPNPLPYEVLTMGVLALLETEAAPGAAVAPVASQPQGGTFAEQGAADNAALPLSPRLGKDGKAGAVWEFTDVYGE